MCWIPTSKCHKYTSDWSPQHRREVMEGSRTFQLGDTSTFVLFGKNAKGEKKQDEDEKQTNYSSNRRLELGSSVYFKGAVVLCTSNQTCSPSAFLTFIHHPPPSSERTAQPAGSRSSAACSPVSQQLPSPLLFSSPPEAAGSARRWQK